MIELPRGPVIVNEKSGSFDVADGYYQRLLRWRESAVDEALSELKDNPEFSDLKRYIDAIEGRQWSLDRPRHRSPFVDNMISQARTDSIAQLTDIQPTIEVSSRRREFEQQAFVINMAILSEWKERAMDMDLISVVDHALFGVGYWKTGAIEGNEYDPPQLTVRSCGMDTVLPVQSAGNIQSSQMVVYRVWKPLNYYRRVWRDQSAGLEKYAGRATITGGGSQIYQRPPNINEYTWSQLSPAMKRAKRMRVPANISGNQDSQGAFPVVELQEFWVDDPDLNDSMTDVWVSDPNRPLSDCRFAYKINPGGRMWPRKRLIVFAGDRLLYDGPSCYWHGMYPFVKMTLNPIVWGPDGLSKYRNLMPINRSMNTTGAGVDDTVNHAVNPIMLGIRGQVPETAWREWITSKAGGKLLLNPNASSASVAPMQPRVLPAYVPQWIMHLESIFNRHSGRMDTSALLRKKQVPGEDTLQMMQNAQAPQARLEARMVERFLEDAGVQAISNILQFWNVETRLRAFGEDGLTRQDFVYDPETMHGGGIPREHQWRMYRMDIARGSLHGAARDRDKLIAMKLYGMHAISREELLRTLDWKNIERINAELQKEAAAQQQAGPQGRVLRMSRAERTGKV